MECNCFICSKRELLHGFMAREHFRLLTPENDMDTYAFNKHTIRYRFCSRCGCAPFGEGVVPDGNYMVTVTPAVWMASTCRL